jgi:5-methylcytosine-specific restriction protein A
MARRPCLGCGKLTDASRCSDCRLSTDNQRYRRRGSRQARGYDAAWGRLVAQAIDAQPWCTDCGIDRQAATAAGNPLTGDHLRWPAASLEDIEVVCRRCNSIRGPLRGK